MSLGDSKPSSSSSIFSSGAWKERIFYPTLLAGIAGGGFGLLSKHRKTLGLANVSATYATNFSIVAACYCGAREFVRASRKTGPDDLLNSAIAGFGSGALLGRLQVTFSIGMVGGQRGAVRYSFIFAVVGTMADYATLSLKGNIKTDEWLKLPEWSPIQVLDEEALAAKRAREEKLLAQRLRNLSKEES